MELRLKQEDASSQATQSKACYYKSIVVKRYVWATESKNAEEQSRERSLSDEKTRVPAPVRSLPRMAPQWLRAAPIHSRSDIEKLLAAFLPRRGASPEQVYSHMKRRHEMRRRAIEPTAKRNAQRRSKGKAGRRVEDHVHQVSFWLALLILAIPDTTSSPQ